MDDFEKKSDSQYISKCKRYKLSRDDKGYYYPCRLFYKGVPAEHNFYCYPVHTGYDYCFSFKKALEILNMVIIGTWKYGEGIYLNGLEHDKR